MSALPLQLLLLLSVPRETQLDLARVSAAALQSAPRAAAARARAEAARLGAQLLQPSAYPEVLLGAKLWAVPATAISSQDTLSGSETGLATRYRMYGSLRVPLLRAAAARQAGEVARAQALEGEREAEVQRATVLRDVAAAYALSRATAAALPAQEGLCAVRERQLRVARARLAGGLGTAAEVARAEELLRAAEVLRDEVRRSGETARARLAALSGLTVGDAALQPIAGRPCESREAAARRAQGQRPEVQLREAEAARLRAQAPLAWRDNLDVTAAFGGTHGTTATLDELNGLFGALELRGALDAPLRARKQIARDQSLARAAQLEAAAQAEQVSFEARGACDGHERALGQARVLEARVTAARSEHERLLSRRELVGPSADGVVEMPQLLEAEAALREAEVQLAEARGQAELAQVAALLAQGDLLGATAPPHEEPPEEEAARPGGPAGGTLYAAAGPLLPSRRPRPEPATTATGPAQRRAVRGMWIWHTRRLLGEPGGAEALRAFVKARGLTEVYLSLPRGALGDGRLAPLVAGLRAGGARVEALLGEATWHLPERRRELLGRIAEVAAWNREQAAGARFDGIHLDIEPQQLSANKGRDNLAFLPDLTASLRAAREAAEAARLTLAADLPRKVLRAGAAERAALLAACPRLVLMLYGAARPAELAAAARLALGGGAQVIVALRPEDHEERLGEVQDALGESLGREAGYLGWAVHDYDSYRKR